MGVYKIISMFTSETSTKAGFDAVIKNESFKCAFITHSPAYAFGKVEEMKRHNETEEIFVLLKGCAVMLIYEDGIFSEYELSENTAYNVHPRTWHYLAVSEDASVFVTERADTDSTNSDIIKLPEIYELKGR